MAAAAVSAGSAGSYSGSRMQESCAISILLIRAWISAAWASRSAVASASVAGSWAARSLAQSGPKMRMAKVRNAEAARSERASAGGRADRAGNAAAHFMTSPVGSSGPGARQTPLAAHG